MVPDPVVRLHKWNLCLHEWFFIEQDMHYAEFAEDEVSNFVRLTHPWIEKE